MTKEDIVKMASFTRLLWYAKPHLKDHVVFDVDVGTKEDYNVVLKSQKLNENSIPTGDQKTTLLAKEWIIENSDYIWPTTQ